MGRERVSLLTNSDSWHFKPFRDIGNCVVGREHVSLLTNLDAWHSKPFRDVGHLLIYAPTVHRLKHEVPLLAVGDVDLARDVARREHVVAGDHHQAVVRAPQRLDRVLTAMERRASHLAGCAEAAW